MKKGFLYPLAGLVVLIFVQFSYKSEFFSFTALPTLSTIIDESSFASDDSSVFSNDSSSSFSPAVSIQVATFPDYDIPDYSELYPKTEIEDLSDGLTSFNSSGIDTLVFLHMQKTGGTTLGRRFVDDIVHLKCKKVRGKKRSYCPRPLAINSDRTIAPSHSGTWIFSRYSTGWVCGLHADWTELNACVAGKMDEIAGKKKRNFIYITNLRNATMRFLSEWKHVQRGATWGSSTLRCGGKEHTDIWDRCFPNQTDWTGVTLEDFTNCPYNLAFNRQTRMLADLELVSCYDNLKNLQNIQKEIELKMLASAKKNLSRMRWFGLVEFQLASEILFEHVFQPLHFASPFQKWNSTHSLEALSAIPTELLDKITRLNHLDVELYEFARELFFQRYQEVIEFDPQDSESENNVISFDD